MSILTMIDVGLGVVLFYLLLSLICTAVTELIATATRLRGVTLRAGLANLFRGSDLLPKLYDFPLVQGLFRGSRRPAEIPPATFATSLIHILTGTGTPLNLQSLLAGINALPKESLVKDGLIVLLDDAKQDIEKLRAGVEAWFNSIMERVSGWYKRWMQLITLALALAIVGCINADTIQLVRTISQDSTIRTALAERAMKVAEEKTPPTAPETVGEIGKQIEDLGLFGIPLGWATAPVDPSSWLLKIVGLLLTAFAITLGAPFWFNLLKQLMSLRSAASGSGNGVAKKT